MGKHDHNARMYGNRGIHRVTELLIPQFTLIRLIPIHNPVSMDVERPGNERAPIWMPDGDTLDSNRHIRARIHGSPVFRHVLQRYPILPLPVYIASQSRSDDIPKCAL